MKRRHYEPLSQHIYRIFVDGCVKYATTNTRRFNREVRKYLDTPNVQFSSGPR